MVSPGQWDRVDRGIGMAEVRKQQQGNADRKSKADNSNNIRSLSEAVKDNSEAIARIMDELERLRTAQYGSG